MKPSPHPARLHVLLARDTKQGLILRRGPAKHVGTFGWDRSTDAIAPAQWLKGRIYERRCDLSPDGRHWIYFAANGHWSGAGRGSWTAVARAPWLKAVVFLPKGDCWQGGGLFLDNQRYWVNGGGCHERREDSDEVKEATTYTPPAWYGGECLTVYYNRLQRDGWTLTSLQSKRTPSLLTVFEKSLSKGWSLHKICHASINRPQGRGVYWDEHVLVSDEGECSVFPDWEWADWVDERIVYAEGGCLYRLPIASARKLGTPDLIHDFNGYTFEAISAPYE